MYVGGTHISSSLGWLLCTRQHRPSLPNRTLALGSVTDSVRRMYQRLLQKSRSPRVRAPNPNPILEEHGLCSPAVHAEMDTAEHTRKCSQELVCCLPLRAWGQADKDRNKGFRSDATVFFYNAITLSRKCRLPADVYLQRRVLRRDYSVQEVQTCL